MWSKTPERAADRLSGAAENAVSSAIERKRLQFETLRPIACSVANRTVSTQTQEQQCASANLQPESQLSDAESISWPQVPSSPSAVATRTRPLIPTGIFRSRSLTTDTIDN